MSRPGTLVRRLGARRANILVEIDVVAAILKG